MRLREAAPQFWLWTFVGFAVFGIVYWRFAEAELRNQKNAVMARQRAVAESIGKEGLALREKLEAWVGELARTDAEVIAPDIDLDAVARGPGIYLRLRREDAKSPQALRSAAQRSLRDGFTSCMFVGRRGDPTQGTPCRTASHCEPGFLCNEWSVCAPPGQPFNLRLLYAALRVLTPEWTRELEEAGNDLAVRALEGDLEKVTKHDVPLAAEIVRRARYFTVVLDEEPEGGVPGLPEGEEKLDETLEQRLQHEPHFARVGIWDVQSERLLASVRAEAAGRFVWAGRQPIEEHKIRRAQQRQANNCALAVEVRERITERSPATSAEANGASPAPGAAAP